MRLGILSDSHGRADITGAAVKMLRERGADVLIYLGDACGEAVIDEFVGHPARIVFGNCDLDIPGLTRYAEILGLHVDHPMGMLETDGKRIAFTHGDRPQLMAKAILDGADYLLHGHTHEVRDDRQGNVRIINPGALHRARRYTAALLDPAADRLDIIEVARNERGDS